MFLKISQMKWLKHRCLPIVFSCCEIFKNTYLEEHLRTIAVSGYIFHKYLSLIIHSNNFISKLFILKKKYILSSILQNTKKNPTHFNLSKPSPPERYKKLNSWEHTLNTHNFPKYEHFYLYAMHYDQFTCRIDHLMAN